ncbi:MAG TPA: hypothetical protein VMV20_07235 [Chitinophagaceae bacterium]|nr:hypothetical protein [Chitinophagaceae bacterium]
MDQMNDQISAKLSYLLGLLDESHQEMENLAEEISDKELKDIVMEVADENFRSIQMLRSILGDLKAFAQEGLVRFPDHGQDLEGIFESCLKLENRFVQAYRDILNQWFPNMHLRRVLQHQLNGIKSGFMKLKLFAQLGREEEISEVSQVVHQMS